jgi:hypothetical protein
MELQGSERDYEDIKATLSELLDGYEYVWGCECWWGPADETKKKLDRDDDSTIALDLSMWNWKVD